MDKDLKAVDQHFDFGRNWASYSSLIDEDRLASAKEGLLKLAGRQEIAGASFLDIGSGSGLHCCAAGLLGAASVTAADIDPKSVATTRKVLRQHLPSAIIEVMEMSVFDMNPDRLGKFDIVYSWGVLHHTGDLAAAIRQAATLVADGGLLILALYRPTYLDWFWKAEKRWYKSASSAAQKRVQTAYDLAFRTALFCTGRRWQDNRRRGMDYWHDLHDWLGGYPYESLSRRGLEALLVPAGFSRVRSFERRKSLGVFGSGCDEFVYRQEA